MRGSSHLPKSERHELDSLVRLHLQGRVDAFEMAKQLGGAVRPGSGQLLLVDWADLQDLDPEGRQLFIDWNVAHRDDVDAVAVITDNPIWHLVVSTMALASHQKMRAFARRTEALEWLVSQLRSPAPERSLIRVRKSVLPNA